MPSKPKRPGPTRDRRDATVVTADLRRTIQAGYLISDIARVAGLHPVTVGEISRGKRATVSVHTVGRILTALDLIEAGEVDVPRVSPKPAVRLADDLRCGRGHLRAEWGSTYSDGVRYCRACQKLGRTRRTRNQENP